MTETARSQTAPIEGPDPEKVKAELLAKYPPKVARKRAKQIIVNRLEPGDKVPEINANVRTVPGLMSQRGCCYAGCKGVVLGPTRDIVNITHGPIGCGFYSWLTRRNQTDPDTTPDGHNFMTYCFSTDMQEKEIIFGGEKKLRQAIQEAYDNFKPKAIAVFATCPVGLIGDDIHSVCREMKDDPGHQRLRFQLRRLQRGQPVGRPSHRQQPDFQARGGVGRHHRRGRIPRQPSRRVQYRRRRL